MKAVAGGNVVLVAEEFSAPVPVVRQGDLTMYSDVSGGVHRRITHMGAACGMGCSLSRLLWGLGAVCNVCSVSGGFVCVSRCRACVHYLHVMRVWQVVCVVWCIACGTW